MTTIAQLGVDLTANSAKFVSELGKAQAALNSHVGRMNQQLFLLRRGFDSVRSAAATFGVGLGAGAIAAFTKESLSAAAGLADAALQMDVSTKALQDYQMAAAMAGVSQEQLRTGLSRLTASIGAAESGNKQAIDGFTGIGVGVLNAAGKVRSTEAVFHDIAAAYQLTGDKAKFAADMKAVMGREAQTLIPVLVDLAEAERRSASDLSDGLITKARQANAAIETMKVSVVRLTETIVAGLSPAIKQLADNIRVSIGGADAQDMIDQLTKKAIELQNKLAAFGNGSQEGALMRAGGLNPDIIQKQLTATLEQLSTVQQLHDALSSPASGPDKTARNPPSDEAVRRAQSIQDVIGKLDAEIGREKALHAAIGANADEIARINGLYDGMNQLTAQRVSIVDPLGAKIVALSIAKAREKAATDDDTKAYTDFLAALDKNAQAYQQMRDNVAGSITEIESQIEQNQIEAQTFGMTAGQIAALNEQRKIQNQLLKDHNVLLPDEATRLNADLKTIQRTTDELARQKAASAELANFATSAFDRIGQAIDNAILQKGAAAFNDFKNIALAVVQEIENAFIKLAIMNPIQKMLGLPGSSNLPTLTDFLSGIFGGGGGASSGLTASSLLDVQLGSFPFHSGGIVGGGSPSRLVPAVAFASAPRFHSGGFIGAGEVPVIARKGEGIFTPEQMAAMGGDTFVINNNFALGVQGTVRAEVMQMMPQIAKSVIAATQDKRSRGKVRSLA